MYSETPLLKTQQKFTIKANNLHDADFLRSWEKEGLTKMFKPSSTSNTKASKYLLKYSQHKGRDAYMYINLSSDQYSQRHLKYLMSRYQQLNTVYGDSQLNTWFNTVNINFLRKERLYTKLKYSRSPAFDIVFRGSSTTCCIFRFLNFWKVWLWARWFWRFLLPVHVYSLYCIFSTTITNRFRRIKRLLEYI